MVTPSTRDPAPRPPLPIALLYQAEGLHEHLKRALTDLGAAVVYDSPAAAFDPSALTRSGAQVVVVNLDPQVEAEIEHLDELLTDDSLRVVFNDAEVSSRLEGSDQARWVRHLAAKILGIDDINPPRPQGAEAIPVRVKAAGPEYVGAGTVEQRFELEGDELARALAADTGESLLRARAALVTSDEPVAADVVQRYAGDEPAAGSAPLPESDLLAAVAASDRSEPPTLELPREIIEATPAFRAEAPTLELPLAELQATPPFRDKAPTLEIPRAEVEKERAFRDHSPTLEIPLSELDQARSFREAASTLEIPQADLARAQAGHEALTPTDAGARAPVDTDALALDAFALDLPAPTPAAPIPELTLEALDLPDLDLPFSAPPAAPPASATVAPKPTPDPELERNLADFGLIDAPDLADAIEPAVAAGEDDFASALGALELLPLDDGAPAPAPAARDVAPLGGLDDMLAAMTRGTVDLELPQSSAAKAGESKPTPAKSEPKPPPQGDPKPEAKPAPPRDISKLDLSHLSLAPIDDDAAPAPGPGRASFVLGQDSKPGKPAAASAKPAPPAPEGKGQTPPESFDFDLGGLGVDRVQKIAPNAPVEDLMAELEVLAAGDLPFAAPDAVTDGAAIQRVWVLGASIGGPEAVREFAAALPAETPALFILAQHMGSDFVDLMTQQLAKATKLRVQSARAGLRVAHGEIVVVPLDARVQVAPDGTLEVEPLTDALPYNPSIDQVLRDVADRYGAAAGAIIFSGMANDAVDGARHLAERGGVVWVQDPSSCVISSMVDGARDAGLVSFSGTPAELARQFLVEYGGA
jgi:two-component system chemotaxis response regulator CheB/chemosensory pili system protein ChpB (putative protein-glutamate methylesterase)